MHISRFAILPAITLLAGTAASQTTKTRAPSKLTIDELIQIKHPSGAQWTSAGVIAGRLGELARRPRSREAISAAITGTTNAS